MPPENLASYLNATCPRNLLAVTGTQDTAAPPNYAQHIIGGATGQTWDAVASGVLSGDFALGTAREFAEFENMDHVTEVFDPRSQNATISWVEQSLSLDTTGLSNPAGRGIGLLAYGAGCTGAVVGFLLLPFIMSYVAQWVYRERRDDLFDKKKVSDKTLNWKIIGAGSLMFFACAGPLTWVVAGLTGGFALLSTTFLIDLLVVPALFFGSIIALVVVGILQRKTAFGRQWVRRENIWPEKPGKAMLVGVLSVTIVLVLIATPLTLVLMNLFPLGPRFLPFVRITLLCLVGEVGPAIVFRSIIGDHIMRRRGFWTGRFIASVVSGVTIAATLSWCLAGTVGDILFGLDAPVAFLLYWGIFGISFIILDFLTTQWAYYLEGGVLGGIIVQAPILGIILSMVFPILL